MAISSGSYTIGGSSPDYATIGLFEADIATTLTGVVEGKIRAGTYAENVIFSSPTNESASLYVQLTYDTGAFHGGVLDSGVVIEPTSSGHVFQLDDSYMRVIGIQVQHWMGESSEAFRLNGDNCRFEQLIMWGAGNCNADGIYLGTAFDYPATGTAYVSNCAFIGLGRTSVLAQGDKAGTVYIYNCTVIECAQGIEEPVGASAGYVALGDDRSDPPTSSGITWHIKNTYSSAFNDTGAPAFGKGSASSWGNSTNNASSDTSAPGTSAQTNATIDSQFIEPGTRVGYGENTGDDVGSVTEDTWINGGATTTNYGSGTTLQFDNSPVQRILMRYDLSGVSNTARVLSARILATINADSGVNISGGVFRLLRAWTEAGVTWNTYDGSTSWATAGATGTGDVQTTSADGDSIGSLTVRSWTARGGDFAAGDPVAIAAGKLTAWVQDAIDGNAPGADANDLDILIPWDSTSPAGSVYFDSSEGTDTERPILQFRYEDTSSAPLNLSPDTAGVLDGNGTNLSSDTDYPISIDLTGRTRAVWDIGAWATGEDELGAASVTLALTAATPIAYRTIQRTASGANRITNGDFETGVISPWGDTSGNGTWSIQSDTGPSGSGSYALQLAKGDTGQDTIWWQSYFHINPSALSEWGGWAKHVSGTAPDYVYIAITEYPCKPISSIQDLTVPEATNIFTSTETTTTADANVSDTSIVVASTAGWENLTGQYYILQWDIENDQSDVPHQRYSSLYPGAYNSYDGDDKGVPGTALGPYLRNTPAPIDGTTIYLDSGLAKFWPSGTKVRQARSGGTYKYADPIPPPVSGSWYEMRGPDTTGYISGYETFSTTRAADGDTNSDDKWRTGSVYAGLTIFVVGGDATTVMRFDDIFFRSSPSLSIVYPRAYDIAPEVTHPAVATESLAITTSAVAELNIIAAGLCRLTIETDPITGGPVQYIRPISDVTVTNFEDELGGTTNLYDGIDEASRSDADYIISTSGGGATYESSLTSSGDPEASDMHTLKVVAESDGGAAEMDATFSIVEGTTVIASWTVESVPSGLVEYAFTMTKEQADAITDYANLRWRVVVTPSVGLFTYFPGDAVGTFTRTGDAYEWVE